MNSTICPEWSFVSVTNWDINTFHYCYTCICHTWQGLRSPKGTWSESVLYSFAPNLELS
jgi:hypothetical protein